MKLEIELKDQLEDLKIAKLMMTINNAFLSIYWIGIGVFIFSSGSDFAITLLTVLALTGLAYLVSQIYVTIKLRKNLPKYSLLNGISCIILGGITLYVWPLITNFYYIKKVNDFQKNNKINKNKRKHAKK